MYVEIAFCNYFSDIDYELIIPPEILPVGFDAGKITRQGGNSWWYRKGCAFTAQPLPDFSHFTSSPYHLRRNLLLRQEFLRYLYTCKQQPAAPLKAYEDNSLHSAGLGVRVAAGCRSPSRGPADKVPQHFTPVWPPALFGTARPPGKLYSSFPCRRYCQKQRRCGLFMLPS